MGSLTKGPHNIGQIFTGLQGTYFGSRLTDCLHHQSYCASVSISIGNRKRDAFAMVSATHYHKVTRTPRPSY